MTTFGYVRRYQGPVHLVILDWAGTTLDYGCYTPAVVFVEVFRRHGVEISIEEARGPMGTHKLVHIRQITQMSAVARRWQEAHGRPCTEEDVKAMFADFVPLELSCLAKYADLIPGTIETMAELRRRGIKIGSTTGYTDEIMKLLCVEAARRGYEPDAMVCASDVPAGRPEPWMCLENAKKLRVFPLEACVKIGDTVPDIEEGLNAGMWTIGLAKTGNELGLNEEEVRQLDPETLRNRLERVYRKLGQAGAHYVVDSIGDILPVLDDINSRLAKGERP